MPETSITVPDSTPDVMASLGVTDTKPVTDKLAANAAEKSATDKQIFSEIDATQSRLLPRIEQLSKDAGVEAEKMKPWNADE